MKRNPRKELKTSGQKGRRISESAVLGAKEVGVYERRAHRVK